MSISVPETISFFNGEESTSAGHIFTGRRFAYSPSALRIPSSPFSGRRSGGSLSNSGDPTAPSSVASAASALFSVSSGSGDPVLRIATPPISPSLNSSECPNFFATTCKTPTAARVTSEPTPSPANTRILRTIYWILSAFIGVYRRPSIGRGFGRLQLPDDFAGDLRDLIIGETLFAISQRGETLIDDVQFLAPQRDPEIVQPFGESVATTVFAQHQPRLRHAYRLGLNDLVSGPLFEIAILMDAGFVRERVFADDRLVGLRSEADQRS